VKPLALLIPGLDGTGLLYFRQIKPLEELYRVLPFQFARRSRFDYCDLVEEIAQAVRDEPAGTVVVVGESFGGTIAMHYVLSHSQKAGRLVLVNTFSFYGRRLLIRVGCTAAPLLQWRFIRKCKDILVDRILAREGIRSEDREQYRKMIKSVYLPAYRRRLELVRDVNLRERLNEIRVPTLLFASGLDKLVPSITEARIMSASIPDSRVFEFPYAGHALLLTPGFSLADYLK
jgi:pimeloyl-ACP methyl ester carboxylesterase